MGFTISPMEYTLTKSMLLHFVEEM
ncbi:hypothetical protein CFP56_040275 [Quercus suber]|uniref:NADH dehydrogenase subunit 2 n=1 Tax=Quercus suber TaxID=58331 RepID=A0AAW0IYE3_QUESU